MVSFLRQIKSDDSAEYVYLRGGRTACTAHSPFSFTSPRIDLLRDGNVWVRIAPNLGASFRGMVRNGVSRAVPCDILNASGEKVGSVVRIREGNFFSANYHIELRLRERVMQGYEIGLGRKGMKYPLYENGVPLSLVEKDPLVRDNLDEYRIYSLDAFGEAAALLFALFLDFHRHRNAGEHVRGKKSFQYVYTRRREVLDKYDPAFRARCEADSKCFDEYAPPGAKAPGSR